MHVQGRVLTAKESSATLTLIDRASKMCSQKNSCYLMVALIISLLCQSTFSGSRGKNGLSELKIIGGEDVGIANGD